ncbi:hybrid sensor histidine kinase/response regulator [Dictyobacter formicarum]|uniref:histidine kinase n=1 Tax=Dictyobacter formicarum TaxID=2778368 RepID=A0ABQ3VE60_9CHLR|nr:HAMP domain-containing sensor histidine kinase [Dictyobacter formicarum]GHO84034.1 hybrid sensor histidine kinase/response regulator [Dictyobacter formicarum]
MEQQYQEEKQIARQRPTTPLVQMEQSEKKRIPRILLVDDDSAALSALSRTFRLRMRDIEVDTSVSAIEALSLLKVKEYDAVISDIKMPGMDGMQLLAKLHENMPEIPVLLITGHGEHELAMQALQEGAYDYTLKPIDRDFFVASVRRALQTRQLLRLVQEKQQALEQYAHSLESQVEQRTRELISVNEAKDRMLSMVAHELATPLTSLKGLLQLAHRRLNNGAIDKAIRDIETMEISANHLGVLIQDLRDAIHIQTSQFVLQRSPYDLVKLCQNVLDEFIVDGISTPCESPQYEPLEVNIDSNRIRQALLNLLTNARKYSPKGTPITVTLQRHATEVSLSVSDRGSGISVEHLAHIYEQFYRVPHSNVQEGEFTGLGLGLYITRAIVEQHGGHMEVQSRPGEGSTFSIILPIFTDDTKAAHESTAEAAPLRITWVVRVMI